MWHSQCTSLFLDSPKKSTTRVRRLTHSEMSRSSISTSRTTANCTVPAEIATPSASVRSISMESSRKMEASSRALTRSTAMLLRLATTAFPAPAPPAYCMMDVPVTAKPKRLGPARSRCNWSFLGDRMKVAVPFYSFIQLYISSTKVSDPFGLWAGTKGLLFEGAQKPSQTAPDGQD